MSSTILACSSPTEKHCCTKQKSVIRVSALDKIKQRLVGWLGFNSTFNKIQQRWCVSWFHVSMSVCGWSINAILQQYEVPRHRKIHLHLNHLLQSFPTSNQDTIPKIQSSGATVAIYTKYISSPRLLQRCHFFQFH